MTREEGGRKWKNATERPINLVWEKHLASMLEITSMQVLHQLRQHFNTARTNWVSLNKLGNHSLRPGAATAMFISGVPEETIKLVGREKGDSFMRFI